MSQKPYHVLLTSHSVDLFRMKEMKMKRTVMALILRSTRMTLTSGRRQAKKAMEMTLIIKAICKTKVLANFSLAYLPVNLVVLRLKMLTLKH